MNFRDQKLRQGVSQYSLALHAREWVANHDGNVSARAGSGFVITPTAVSKRDCGPDELVQCDEGGTPLGSGRPPSEVALHVGAYAHEHVGAVIHAHPPVLTALSILGRAPEPVVLPEVVVSLGPRFAIVPRFLPKDPAVKSAVTAALKVSDVLILGGNGALSVGPDLETAYLRLELFEHYARVWKAAKEMGEVQPLPQAELESLLELRKKAGLLKPADQTAVDVSERMKEIVVEELSRALGETR